MLEERGTATVPLSHWLLTLVTPTASSLPVAVQRAQGSAVRVPKEQSQLQQILCLLVLGQESVCQLTLGLAPQRQLEGKQHHNGRMGLGHQPGPGAAFPLFPVKPLPCFLQA